jgi:hypothetical protein
MYSRRPGPGLSRAAFGARTRLSIPSTRYGSSVWILQLARNADPSVLDSTRQSPQSIAKDHPDPAVKLFIRKAVITARCKAELLDLKTLEKARIAREKAREAARLARDQQKRAMKEREEANARQRAKEAREREEATG